MILPGIGGCIAGAAANAVSGPRYWRLVARQLGAGGLAPAMVDLELRSGGTDQTGSGTASASADRAGEEADKAFDNNGSTFWQATAAVGMWIKYDFGAGAGQDITEIAITPNVGSAGEMFLSFDMQSSPDDSTWTTEWVVDYAPSSWTGPQVVFTKPTLGAARRWRIRADTLVSGNTMSCAEMEWRLSLGGTDETGSGTASASTTFGGFPASNAFDNNTGTLWSGNAGIDDCEYLAYDFGSGVTKAIVQASFTARNDGSYTQSPTAGWIESGSDGISWLPVKRFTGLSWSAGATNTIAW